MVMAMLARCEVCSLRIFHTRWDRKWAYYRADGIPLVTLRTPCPECGWPVSLGQFVVENAA